MLLDPYKRYPQPKLYLPSLRDKIEKWIANEGIKTLFVTLWIVSQLLMFSIGLVYYGYGENFQNARSLLGITFPIARASALCLHVDSGIILFPMCRNFISWLRKTALNSVIPFDKNIEFHKMIGWSIFLFTVIHTVAHYFNFYWISSKDANTPSWLFLSFVTGPGWTGHLMLFALLAIVCTAIGKVRTKNFELFWYTHHLFALYFFGFTIHGAFCLVKTDKAPYCKEGGGFWKYWIVSGFIYGLERILREFRGFQYTKISKVVLHPSNVLEIQIKKDVKSRAGQWIFLNCPAISIHQWHPFTLTSSPEEDYISVHVRLVGNFTKALADKLGCYNKEQGVQTKLPGVMVDGPFGSASEDVFNYEVAVLVGAGIGVTPFASVLKSIWYRVNYPVKKTRLRKVYFVWICREKEAFEWFQDLLKAIEEEDIDNFIEIHTYLTGRFKEDEMANVIINDEEGKEDAVTRLRAPTHFGRPNWDNLFSGFCHLHPATDIGVFFCGPKVLSDQLDFYCSKYNQPVEDGTKFYFGKENF